MNSLYASIIPSCLVFPCFIDVIETEGRKNLQWSVKSLVDAFVISCASNLLNVHVADDGIPWHCILLCFFQLIKHKKLLPEFFIKYS
jgi:hypothetical protein